MIKKIAIVFVAVIMLGGCSTWSDTKVTQDGKPVEVDTSKETAKTAPDKIIITDGDITNKKYKVLGDIEVTVNKTTIFNADPTEAMVDDKLREKASEMGADAVIFVRYGSVGVSFFSWGSLDGKGRAVAFQ